MEDRVRQMSALPIALTAVGGIAALAALLGRARLTMAGDLIGLWVYLTAMRVRMPIRELVLDVRRSTAQGELILLFWSYQGQDQTSVEGTPPVLSSPHSAEIKPSLARAD